MKAAWPRVISPAYPISSCTPRAPMAVYPTMVPMLTKYSEVNNGIPTKTIARRRIIFPLINPVCHHP